MTLDPIPGMSIMEQVQLAAQAVLADGGEPDAKVIAEYLERPEHLEVIKFVLHQLAIEAGPVELEDYGW